MFRTAGGGAAIVSDACNDLGTPGVYANSAGFVRFFPAYFNNRTNLMATEIIRQRPLVSGFNVETITEWIKTVSQKMLRRKKSLIIGAAGVAGLAAAAFYFWGTQASAAQYLTARVERGNLRNTVTATGTLQAVTIAGWQPGLRNDLCTVRRLQLNREKGTGDCPTRSGGIQGASGSSACESATSAGLAAAGAGRGCELTRRR